VAGRLHDGAREGHPRCPSRGRGACVVRPAACRDCVALASPAPRPRAALRPGRATPHAILQRRAQALRRALDGRHIGGARRQNAHRAYSGPPLPASVAVFAVQALASAAARVCVSGHAQREGGRGRDPGQVSALAAGGRTRHASLHCTPAWKHSQ